MGGPWPLPDRSHGPLRGCLFAQKKVCGHEGGHVQLIEVAGSNRLAGLNRTTYVPSVGSLFRCSPDPKLDRSLLGMDVLNRFQIMYADGYMTMRSNHDKHFRARK